MIAIYDAEQCVADIISSARNEYPRQMTRRNKRNEVPSVTFDEYNRVMSQVRSQGYNRIFLLQHGTFRGTKPTAITTNEQFRIAVNLS